MSRFTSLPFMVSYAQNAEDVVLRRAFRGECGYYVDVGACYPVEGSLTKHFYDKGWSGINIEPQPHLHQLLVAERTRDVNLQLAIGSRPGDAPLTTYPGDAPLGTISHDVVREHQRHGWPSTTISVEVVRLESVLKRYVKQSIDFLKIDVEGSESDVLESFDLTQWRPRALVIEATFPRTPQPTYPAWEHYMSRAGYVRTLFDGLNCFYAQSDDAELVELLSTPANVFDQFVPYRFWRLLDAKSKRALMNEARLHEPRS
ncbi:MAG: FkbM family methyltransferase [Pseudonocardiaceae bacterium]